MATCARCGRESPDDFGFCPGCGASLVAVPAREVRKVVTVLFCDLTGSTAIGERTDPEALRTLMTRYYETARGVLERHGGTVEKFVGDAVMAVFGIPVASEDDALRATRAAVELRDVVQELGLDARIGVNTGAVVAGEGDTLVTGDAVNVAARLEQAAGAGEILLGADTLRLVRDAVEAEPLELALKGKSGTVPAHRLQALDARAVGVARRLERPMVGRARERARLRADFDEVAENKACRLFTLIGAAGVGKSRLVADFLDTIGGHATVARGRALSYGDGITYWPLVELFVQLGIDPHAVIRTSAADTQLGARAAFERLAEERPVVLLLDDLQWAEPPLLDLVEHVVDWSRGSPIFLLCVARPELLDVRPGWGGGKLNATSVLLEPLPGDDAAALVDSLLESVELAPETRARVLESAEGNPLFLEEMAALAREADGRVEVPPTIQALLQARLDTLGDAERAVTERGAVEGMLFHRGGVVALAPEEVRETIPLHLLSLVRKEVVRPDRTQIPEDDAFRFRHLLIRDTAYESLPKAVRAELHERFAGWLDEHAAMFERDEIIGHHLGQAARYRVELDPRDPRARELGTSASAHLGSAGRAALERGDTYGAQTLLERAVALASEPVARRSLLPELVESLVEGGRGRERSDELLAELREGDPRERAVATALAITNFPVGKLDELLGRLDDAEHVLVEAGDAAGLTRCEVARGWCYWAAARATPAFHAWRRASEQLRSRDRRIPPALGEVMLLAAMFGGAHVDEVRALIDDLESAGDVPGPLFEAMLRAWRAQADYVAGLGDVQVTRDATQTEIELLEQTGAEHAALAASRYLSVIVPWLDSDDEAVEQGLRRDVEISERVNAHLYLANALAQWALALCALGDHAAARVAVARGRELAQPDDVSDQQALDLAEAYARALEGAWPEVAPLLERARALADRTDMSFWLAEPEHVESRIRALRGELDEARGLLSGLVERVEARGFRRVADRYRRDLAALDSAGRD